MHSASAPTSLDPIHFSTEDDLPASRSALWGPSNCPLKMLGGANEASVYEPVGWAGIVAPVMQEQRPGWDDGRTKKGACRVADSL
jgi:hypothetical protein